MKKIKIGYFADGPWSHVAFEKLRSDARIVIQFIVPRFDTTDIALKNYAATYNIDYFKNKNINSEEFIQKIKSYDCDLLISMSFNQIFKKQIINLTHQGIINVHAGKLPFYRGRNILNWALINDEKEYGITLHYVDEGIDTGDIILQRTYSITDEDTYKTLLENSYIECADILLKGVEHILDNKVDRIPQKSIHPFGFYCGRRGVGDENINWNQTSRELFNFVRSICLPGPQARAFLKSKEIKINKVREFKGVPSYKGVVGQVLAKTTDGFLVKTTDTYIEVLSYQYDGKVRTGDRFTL